jgi:hypothetical protein
VELTPNPCSEMHAYLLARATIMLVSSDETELKLEVFVCYGLVISSWLQIETSWLRFPALPDFLSSIGLGTGSTQPGDDNGGNT